jgi:hypothetical protein
MTVKINPEQIHYRQGTGSQITSTVAPADRNWLCSNFRITLGPLPCNQVAKIDSFTWKQQVIRNELGQNRMQTRPTANVEVPNLTLTISMADIRSWQDWFRSFVIEGQCSDADELTGAITLLAADLRNELAEIELHNVGIISLQQFEQEAAGNRGACFTVELYVEKMTFSFEGGM